MTSAFSLPGARRAVAVVATALFVMAGCADTDVPRGSDPIGSVSPVVTVPPTIGRVGCDPPSRSSELDAGLEVEGAVEGGGGRDQLWALFEGGEIRAGAPVDVYWRIGGDKALRITLVGPNDRIVAVSAPRPQPHPEWDRPGEPWVSTITFPQPGCWRVYVERSRREGDLWVVVD
jgi:hypothetical protein